MKSYKTVTPHPIDVSEVYISLTGSAKLPAKFVYNGVVNLPMGYKGCMGSVRMEIVIREAVAQGVPRTFVIHNGRLVPLGRTAQAKA